MLSLAPELLAWYGRRRPFAVATVVAVRGSAPREPGAALAVDSDGTAIGSVSGGCVEGAVYELCRELLAAGDAARPVRQRFGYSDGDAFAVGLTCGGTIDVLVERIDPKGRPELGPALAAAASGHPAAVARVIDGPPDLFAPHRPRGALTLSPAAGDGGPGDPEGAPYSGTLGDGGRDRAAVAGVRAMLEGGRTGTLTVGTEDGDCEHPLTLFVECCAPPPRMLVYGAVDFAGALARIGTYLGYEVTVCDARPVFATAERFPEATHVVVDWPHRHLAATRTDHRTVVCVLTHDAKFDVPLLERALRMPLAYVGAMGSRRTHEDRLRRLRESGLSEDELAGLYSPVGLDLGGRTPEETALSIAAEIVAVRRGGTGLSLTHGDGPVHRPAGSVPVSVT